MILPDTSLWIEWIRDFATNRKVRDSFSQFVTCGPIVQEVPQGLGKDPYVAPVRASLLALPRLSDPMPLDIFLHAAGIFREGRRKGYTIRSSMDCLIAAVAIENEATVWHKDRDFDFISRYTPLRVKSEYVN